MLQPNTMWTDELRWSDFSAPLSFDQSGRANYLMPIYSHLIVFGASLQNVSDKSQNASKL
jgi:hypothetical protein